MDTPVVGTLDETMSEARQVPATFHGDTQAWFRVWIVNMALTLVTVGVYSAWAKVRHYRYFYSHTEIDGGRFDYHANPVAILIGRIIALVMFGSYALASNYFPVVGLVILLIIFLLMPFLVVRSRAFNMRNTSYRGIRFNFNRDYGGALKVYWGGALITILSLGMAAPYVQVLKNRFAANNSSFGRSKFAFVGDVGEFYAIYLIAIGLSFVALIGAVVGIMAIGAIVTSLDLPDDFALGAIGVLSAVAYILAYTALLVFIMVRVRNYVWNHATLDGEVTFESTLSVREMLWIYFTNLLAIVFSLGLAIPWAQIRLAKYRADHFKVNLTDGWDKYLADNQDPGSALGDELGEAFDLDVDIGF